MKKILTLLFPVMFFSLHAAEATVESVNTLLGLNLFAARECWSFPAMRTRLRLNLTGSTGRYSVRLNRQIAGADAAELVIYTTDNDRRVSRISIIYANKGDSGDGYRSQIRDTERAVKDALTRLLGPGRRTNFVAGTLRTRADMWQCRFAKFYLEVEKREFSMLHITPPGTAQQRQSAGDQDYSNNVRRSDFGDVFIPNVPMVDQGPKGYCVPATMERIFLYYGISLDMHHLADVGGTERGGGTRTRNMMQDIAALRRRAGLRSSSPGSLSVRTVARYIDRGYPVLWQMYSTRQLNELYLFSRRNRPLAATPQAWKRTLRGVDLPRSTEGPHVCLIIGYNRQTDEIAVTNSWGQAHIAPIWIPVRAAQNVSRDLLVVYP